MNVALVGAGGHGRANLRALLNEPDAQVVAVADQAEQWDLDPCYSKGHHRDWLDACKGGPASSANFEYGARLTELTLLGVLSLRLDKKIVWDGAALKARNLPEADAVVKEQYRKGWEIG